MSLFFLLGHYVLFIAAVVFGIVALVRWAIDGTIRRWRWVVPVVFVAASIALYIAATVVVSVRNGL